MMKISYESDYESYYRLNLLIYYLKTDILCQAVIIMLA